MATKTAKNKKIDSADQQKVLQSIDGLEVASVVNGISSLQVSIHNTLSELGGELTTKLQTLENVNAAISIKEKRLEELYEIEKTQLEIEQIKAQKQVEAEAAQAERDSRNKIWAEEAAEHNKLQLRQDEEWKYNFAINKKKAEDELANQIAASRKAEVARSEELLKTWTIREEALKAREQELADLKKTVSEFDARLKSEVSAREAIVSNTLKRQYEHDIALLKKDNEADKSANQIKAANYEGTIKNLNDQINDLKNQISIVRADAKEVATKALESASDRGQAAAFAKALENQQGSMPRK